MTQTTKPPAKPSYGKIILTLENCLLPEAKLDPTPSQMDGLDRETEIDLRVLGCELIQTAGILLKLPQVAMAAGQVLFQRFFYSKSFVRHSMETTAMSCICLASKIEEAPRRIRDVINVFHHIRQVRSQKEISSLVLDQNYISQKTQVIKAERRVLKELGFCVHVKHPHKLIVMYLQVLGYEKNQKMMQIAWNFMNDSLRTDVFVRYQPETIACACIYLTARKLNVPLPTSPSWYEIFKVDEDQIVDVCYRIMALYKRTKPNVEKLEDAVEQLKKKYMESRTKSRSSGQNTPPSVTIIDRSNGGGTHNAWGGFISRNLPAEPVVKEQGSSDKEKKRSYSKSRSRSPSADTKTSHYRSKKGRHRSRTPVKATKKKSRNHSRSASFTPPPVSHSSSNKSKKNDKRRSASNERGADRGGGGGGDYYTNGGDRGSNKYSSSRDKDRHRDRDRSRDRDRERSRERERSRDRERSRERDRSRDRERSRERERGGSGKDKGKFDSYSNKGGHRSSKHSRDRDRDRKR